MDRLALINGKESILQKLKAELNGFQVEEFKNEVEFANSNAQFDYVVLNLQTINKQKIAINYIKANSNVNIIVTCKLKFKPFIPELLEMGISGFIFSPLVNGELKECISTIAEGKRFYSLEFPSISLPLMIKEKNLEHIYGKVKNITRKEVKILKLISDEYTNPEIAEKFGLSVRTIDSHRRNILIKIGAKNTAGLVKFTCRTGICK